MLQAHRSTGLHFRIEVDELEMFLLGTLRVKGAPGAPPSYEAARLDRARLSPPSSSSSAFAC